MRSRSLSDSRLYIGSRNMYNNTPPRYWLLPSVSYPFVASPRHCIGLIWLWQLTLVLFKRLYLLSKTHLHVTASRIISAAQCGATQTVSLCGGRETPNEVVTEASNPMLRLVGKRLQKQGYRFPNRPIEEGKLVSRWDTCRRLYVIDTWHRTAASSAGAV